MPEFLQDDYAYLQWFYFFSLSFSALAGLDLARSLQIANARIANTTKWAASFGARGAILVAVIVYVGLTDADVVFFSVFFAAAVFSLPPRILLGGRSMNRSNAEIEKPPN